MPDVANPEEGAVTDDQLAKSLIVDTDQNDDEEHAPTDSQDDPADDTEDDDTSEGDDSEDDKTDEDESDDQPGDKADDDDEEVEELDFSQDDVDQVIEYLNENEVLTIKVNGEEKTVTLKDALKGHQFESDYRQKTAKLSESQRQADQQMVQYTSELEAQAARIDEALSLVPAVQGSDQEFLTALAEEDPAEYVATRARLDAQADVRKRLEDEKRTLADQHQKASSRKAQSDLRVAIPEWQDDKVYTKELKEIAEYATSELGYPPERISAITNAADVITLRKAMMYDRLQSKAQSSAKVVKKKLKRAPVKKVLKGGSPKSKKQMAAASSKDTFNKLAQTGSNDALVDWMTADAP